MCKNSISMAHRRIVRQILETDPTGKKSCWGFFFLFFFFLQLCKVPQAITLVTVYGIIILGCEGDRACEAAGSPGRSNPHTNHNNESTFFGGSNNKHRPQPPGTRKMLSEVTIQVGLLTRWLPLSIALCTDWRSPLHNLLPS